MSDALEALEAFIINLATDFIDGNPVIDWQSVIAQERPQDLMETIKQSLEWQPKERFEHNGSEVIAWMSSQKGFEDVTEKLIYIDLAEHLASEEMRDVLRKHWPKDGWYWANSEELVKRPDLIKGVMPWPEPPKD